jgi:hypothetical protein
MVTRLRDDISFNPLYDNITKTLRVYFSFCLEMRKYLALNKLCQLIVNNGDTSRSNFRNTYSDVFLLHGFTEVLSQNSFSFNLNLQTSGGQAVFATFNRSTTSETFFRFSSLNNYAASGQEVHSTSRPIQEQIQKTVPRPGSYISPSLTDESAWQRLVWFVSEHRIISPSLTGDPDSFRSNLELAFSRSAQDFAASPQNPILAWDTVSKNFLIILPIYLTPRGTADLAVGFRFYSRNENGFYSYFIDPASIRLFSLSEAYLRAQVIRPLGECWLTDALAAGRTN